MSYDYEIQFNLKDCIKGLGLEPRGRVQKVVTEAVLMLSEPYVPFDVAGLYDNPVSLIDSGHIEGTDVVWGTGGNRDVPYARRLYYHPEYNFQGSPRRGGYWVDRMLQEGGLKKIEDMARKEASK